MNNLARKLETRYTPAEYLASEAQAAYKSEYFDGEIFVMAQKSANHNRITLNVCTEFKIATRRTQCEVFSSDLRILVEQNGLYTYPDAMLVCGEVQFQTGRDDTITNPQLIVEVLSKSTKNYDRGSKFTLYRDLPSLRHYILIDQYTVRVEYYHQDEQGNWSLTELTDLDDKLAIESLGLAVSLRDIYDNVDWLENQLNTN